MQRKPWVSGAQARQSPRSGAQEIRSNRCQEKSLPCSVRCARSGIIPQPRIGKRLRTGWSSASSVRAAASTRTIARLSKARSAKDLYHDEVDDKNRGVSSTVKLPVSKTGLGGSNPSAPARFLNPAPGGYSGREKGSSTRMAKTATATMPKEGSFGERVKSWPLRIKTFYNDVRTEMKKVTTPSRKE